MAKGKSPIITSWSHTANFPLQMDYKKLFRL